MIKDVLRKLGTKKIPEIVTDETYLRQKSRPTTRQEIKRVKVVEKIQLALTKSWTLGYGLAAIQIGIPIKAAWYRIPAEESPTKKEITNLLVNPKILKLDGFFVLPDEGCLSFPGQRLKTRRASMVLYENDGKNCMAEGLEAIIIQHEIDHIYGTLYKDRVFTQAKKWGRNEPCFCGSGLKYKKCCGR